MLPVEEPNAGPERHAEAISPPAKSQRYVVSQSLPVSIEEAFAYHERPGCLQRLIPPWDTVEVESSDASLQVGSRVILKAGLFGIPVRWNARHTVYDPPHRFADIQDSGPFAFWHHQHRFAATGSTSCQLTDEVLYKAPAGTVGQLLGGPLARKMLERMFAYRHRITHDDLQLFSKHSTQPLCVAVSGSSGLVGSALCNLLRLYGHRVLSITRSAQGDEDSIAAWSDESEFERFNEVDAVVHLAGKSIASERWTDSVKQELRESRVEKTTLLAQRLARLSQPPKVMICASATGFYGDRGKELLDETSSPGDDFLAAVSQQWEAACRPAQEAGIRVVNTRFGIVLSLRDGALKKMLMPAKAFGGSLGSGNQYWSWIALDDAIGGIVHAIHTESLSGPVNFVSPSPTTNREFAQTLAQVVGRKALFPAPATFLRIAVGEMADALLLASTRVVPERLARTGYEFRFHELEDVLRYSLGKERLPGQLQDE